MKIRFVGSIPDDLYTRIPETAYHLRSALDQLVVALAKASGITNTKHIYFPFAGDANEFVLQRTQQKIKGIKPGAAELMRGPSRTKGKLSAVGTLPLERHRQAQRTNPHREYW